jgi:hypothetical protein
MGVEAPVMRITESEVSSSVSVEILAFAAVAAAQHLHATLVEWSDERRINNNV